MNRPKIFLGTFFITLAVLILELTLTRLFSATMYYHFAFMAISLALFGSGASGVFVYVVQRRLAPARTGQWLAAAALMFGATTLLALYVILARPLTLEPGMENYYRLTTIYMATALPFFFAGCAVTLAITRLASDISRLYLFDLAGAALGCLLMIPLLNTLGAINTVLLSALLGGVVAVLFSTASGGGRAALAASVTGAVAFGGVLGYNLATNQIDVRMTKGYEEQNVVFSKWNSFSRITVSGDFNDSMLTIKIDSDAATGITKDAAKVELHPQQRDRIEALVYNLKREASVLIIGPGGGGDVMTARVFGHRPITAVEINPIIARDVMSSEPFTSYHGSLYQQPDVRLVVDEGRSFIRSHDERYDIIQATMVDTWAATAAGAFSLTENNLYTVEAFKEYVEHLTNDGMLTMTRWYFEPPDQLLRLISLTRAMMAELGIEDAPNHIMLVRDGRGNDERTPATFLFKKSAFTPEEVRAIEEIAARKGYELLYTPNTRPPNVFRQMIEAEDPATVWKAFETNVEPTYDNNPFFFNSLKVSDLGRGLRGAEEWRKTNLGTFVLFALFGITSVLVVLFIIGPLALSSGRAMARGAASKFSYLFYFACLGAGFIIVEVAMIQKFILFLGHPVYALAVVLFSLLTFSAIGSYLTGRFDEARLRPTLARVLAGLVALVAVYILMLPPIFYGLVGLPLWARIVIAVVLMAPLALVMGMPMPTGIKILSREAPEIIPWAWGINGATSVTGTVAALVIAILSGFNQALLVGSAFYLAAIFFMTRSRESAEAREAQTSVEESVGA